MRRYGCLMMLVAALVLLMPQNGNAVHAYKTLTMHKGVVGLHLGPSIPVTGARYDGYDIDWDTMFQFGFQAGYLISPMAGIHIRFDTNFAFLEGGSSGSYSFEFPNTIVFFDFGPVIESNLSFFRFPLYFGPELGLAFFTAFADYMDTQVGMFIRPALSVMYTINRRFDIRFTPVRISIMIPFTEYWDEEVGTQVAYDLVFTGRYRF